jgi:hypothetical protein
MTTVPAAKNKAVGRRLLIGLGALVVPLIGYSVYSIARPTVLRSEIEIAATPDQLWKVLADRATLAARRPPSRRNCWQSNRTRSCTGKVASGSVAVPVMTWLNTKIKPQFDASNQALAARVGD